jgi:hypothetical protein
MIHAPWAHRDEHGLHDLMRRAREQGRVLEVVAGSAPGWAEPWARARPCWVRQGAGGWGRELVDEEGLLIDERDIQLARIAEGPALRIVKSLKGGPAELAICFEARGVIRVGQGGAEGRTQHVLHARWGCDDCPLRDRQGNRRACAGEHRGALRRKRCVRIRR